MGPHATPGWDRVAEVLSQPDSLPVLMMIGLVSLFTWLSLSDGRRGKRSD